MLDSLYGKRANGEEFLMEAFLSQSEIDGQKFFTVIFQDITERRHAEDALDLHIGDHDPLRAHGVAHFRIEEEHITTPKQGFRAGVIQNNAAINTRRHRKSKACREVGFDKTRHHIGGWALGGNHKMNARGTRHLRKK